MSFNINSRLQSSDGEFEGNVKRFCRMKFIFSKVLINVLHIEQC